MSKLVWCEGGEGGGLGGFWGDGYVFGGEERGGEERREQRERVGMSANYHAILYFICGTSC